MLFDWLTILLPTPLLSYLVHGKKLRILLESSNSYTTLRNNHHMSDNQALFQAVGIIRGEVKIASERGKPSTVSIQGKDYALLYIPTKQGFKALEALTKQVDTTGNNQRLIVYPKLTHFPGRDKQHEIAFQLVGFDRGLQSEGVTADLADFEFKLCGLWQFIPVCPTPCISVFKNFTSDRLEFVKQSEVYKRVKFMKGSHIPVIWNVATVKPFRLSCDCRRYSWC